MRLSLTLLLFILIGVVSAQNSTRCRAVTSDVVSSGITFSGQWTQTDEIARSTLVAGSCAELPWTGSSITWNVSTNISDPWLLRGQTAFTVQIDGGYIVQRLSGPYVSPLLEYGAHRIRACSTRDNITFTVSAATVTCAPANELQNSGFEGTAPASPFASWWVVSPFAPSLPNGTVFEARRDNSVAHSGNASGLVFVSEANPTAMFLQQIPSLFGRLHLLTGWLKTENVSVGSASLYAYNARPAVNLRDDFPGGLGNLSQRSEVVNGTSGVWVQRSMYINSPLFTVACGLGLRTPFNSFQLPAEWPISENASGYVNCDDIRLKPIEASPVSSTPRWKMLIVVSSNSSSNISVAAVNQLARFFNEDLVSLTEQRWRPPRLYVRYTAEVSNVTEMTRGCPYDALIILSPDAENVNGSSNSSAVSLGKKQRSCPCDDEDTTVTPLVTSLNFSTAFENGNLRTGLKLHFANFFQETYSKLIVPITRGFLETGIDPPPPFNGALLPPYVQCWSGAYYDRSTNETLFDNDVGFYHDFFSGRVSTWYARISAFYVTNVCMGTSPEVWSLGGPRRWARTLADEDH